jgi:predicted AlkP superfamily pyrophosphatase or phosphodiesterase
VSDRLQVIALIDALGWEYIRERRFLDDVLPYRNSLQTVLGFSSGAIPTILTGQMPERHGHWNLFYYDPQHSPFWWLKVFNWLPNQVLDNRYGRKILKELGRRVLGLGPTFECCVSPRLLPYFNFSERRDIYAPKGIENAPSLFDELEREGRGYRVYTYHQCSDAEILRRARRDIAESDASLFFLYLCEVDGFLHMHCKEPEAIDQKLQWYDQQLREVFDVARKRDPEASLMVCSDHGMTPVTQHADLVGEVAKLGLRMPQDYLAVYDSTMARFWFFDDAARERVTAVMRSLTCGSVLSRQELDKFGLHFPDDRYGELIFLLHPGWMVAESDFNGKGWFPEGMHGYHPDDSYSDAIFLSSEKPSQPMRSIADVYYSIRAAGRQTTKEKVAL